MTKLSNKNLKVITKKNLEEACLLDKMLDEKIKELKALQEDNRNNIKTFLGDKEEEHTKLFTLTYKVVEKQIADPDKMKKAGIFDEFSKPSISRPLRIL